MTIHLKIIKRDTSCVNRYYRIYCKTHEPGSCKFSPIGIHVKGCDASGLTGNNSFLGLYWSNLAHNNKINTYEHPCKES